MCYRGHSSLRRTIQDFDFQYYPVNNSTVLLLVVVVVVVVVVEVVVVVVNIVVVFNIYKYYSNRTIQHAEEVRTQIQSSKPKWEITKITNCQNTKRTHGEPSEQLTCNTVCSI